MVARWQGRWQGDALFAILNENKLSERAGEFDTVALFF